jgi:hypothetical protein
MIHLIEDVENAVESREKAKNARLNFLERPAVCILQGDHW